MKLLLMLSILSFSTFTYGYSNMLTFTGKIVTPACKFQIINGQAVPVKKEINCVSMNKSTEKYVYKSENIQTHPSGKIITISYL